jgi:hypothetical protein
MTVLNHSLSELMASFLHRKSLSRGPEGKPTGTDESWCGQKNARSCGTEVGREGAASQQVWPVRSRGALVVHAWLFSLDLKKCGELTTRAPSAIRKRWTV